MKSTKSEIRFFDVMDYEKEAAYLSKMHSKGWKFVFVSFPGIYRFVKCQPEDARYQLDYNADGIQNKEEYQKMFEDMGWEYLLDFVGYSYFRKPVTEENCDEEIFCDDDSRWEMVKRVFRGRVIPLLVIFFLAILPTLLMGLVNYGNPENIFYELLIPAIILCILYVSIFIRFTVKYINFKRKLGR